MQLGKSFPQLDLLNEPSQTAVECSLGRKPGVTVKQKLLSPRRGRQMKKSMTQRRDSRSDEMLPQYDFDYKKAKPNRFAGRTSKRVNRLNKPNQRIGAINNSQVGADFELVALKFFRETRSQIVSQFRS